MLPLCVGPVTGGVVTVPEPVPGGGLVGIVTLELPIGVGTIELAEETVGKRVNPGVAVVSVLLLIGAAVGVGERMALVRSETMPPMPPDDDGVGATEDAAEVTAVDTSVALALAAGVRVGATALVISEMIPPKMPDAEVVGAAEETAGGASVELAVGAGATALVIPEMMPPKRSDEEATGAAEDATEVTSGAAEDAAEVT